MTVTTTSFETTDLDQACDLLALAYADGRLQLSAPDPVGLRLAQTRHDCGPAYLDTFTSTLPLSFEIKLEGVVMVCRILDGGLSVDDGHQPFTVGRGDLFAATTRRPYRSVQRGTTIGVVGVELPLLADLAATSVDDVERRLEHHLVDPARARAWNETVSAVTEYLTGPMRQVVDGTGGRLLVDSTNRILAAAMLDTLLPAPDPVPQDRGDARPETLRRAVAFIESNPDAAITVVDIARAAGATPRAVRLSFRRHLDTTATDYLRRVRLDHARADLSDATVHDDTTVATVAARWGFGSLARFDQHYRRAHGEPPSTTLQR